MAHKFNSLRAKMPPESLERARKKAENYRREMALDELREARKLTQERLAEILGVKQAAVSKLERRSDMYISTLRRIIEAMGGKLEIRAVFPAGVVRISQFGDARKHRKFQETVEASAG